MATVNGIPLCALNNGLSGGAVALSLSSPVSLDEHYKFPIDGWEVELRARSEHLVARTDRPLLGTALVDAAIDIAHRALDLVSVERGEQLAITAPADNYTVFELSAGQRIVRHHAISNLHIGVQVEVTKINPDGTIDPATSPPPIQWTPAFRFHRLSQGSRDLFDAFRNMFLGLEALLDQIFPKGKKEKEKEWLLRSVNSAGIRVNLAQIATPGVTNPAQNIVDTIYSVRLHLFHAKSGRTLLPDERLSYTTVAKAYPVLLTLWTEIAREWLQLNTGAGGVTHEGFRHMMSVLQSARIEITADSSPPDRAETRPSPTDLPIHILTNPLQIYDEGPGRVALCGRSLTSALPTGQIVGRVAVVLDNGTLFLINAVPGGISLENVDVFEAISVVRLVNRNLPRTEF